MVSGELARNVIGVYGEAGAAWLGPLPRTIAKCEQQDSVSVC